MRELEKNAAAFLAAQGVRKTAPQGVVAQQRPRAPSAHEAQIIIRFDLLRWMLERKMIDILHFQVGRRFQGLYLSSLIGPPVCRLGIVAFGRSGHHGGSARADITYPGESVFSSMKKLCAIEQRLRPRSVRALRTILCTYSLEDDGQMSRVRPLIFRNHGRMRALLQELAWAMGYTTENPYAQR